MELIFASAFCSVVVSILLKTCKSKGFDILQMIVWNYAVASILCFWWFKPDLAHISIAHTPWWLVLVLGVVLPAIFLCLSKSLQTAGILKTEIAQRLSVVLSLLAAYFLFKEHFNQIKMAGIGLGITAVIFILFSHARTSGKATSIKGILYLLSVWGGYALVDVLLKYTTSLGMQFSVTLNLIFIFSFLLSSVYLFILKTTWNFKSLFTGIALGILNFANIAFYIKAHMLLKDSPAIVFAGMNILVVIFGVLAGLFIFKEKIKMATGLGLLFGIAGVVCLALAI